MTAAWSAPRVPAAWAVRTAGTASSWAARAVSRPAEAPVSWPWVRRKPLVERQRTACAPSMASKAVTRRSCSASSMSRSRCRARSCSARAWGPPARRVSSSSAWRAASIAAGSPGRERSGSVKTPVREETGVPAGWEAPSASVGIPPTPRLRGEVRAVSAATSSRQVFDQAEASSPGAVGAEAVVGSGAEDSNAGAGTEPDAVLGNSTSPPKGGASMGQVSNTPSSHRNHP